MEWRGAAKGPATQPAPGTSLGQQLTDIKANVARYVPEAKMEPVWRAVRELQQSGIAQRVLPAGAVAPGFVLPDQSGKIVSSAELLERGPLIINFFRGRWCPYCVAMLEEWQRRLADVQASGASLIAISPQKPQHTFFTADQHKLRYAVLSDAGNAVARQFGLVYRVPDYLEEHYRRVFINLPNTNGDNTWELPIPATYVIGHDGRVLYAFASADFTERAEPEEVISRLQGSRA